MLFAQWRELGVPFTSPLGGSALEVIDPEELIWCSLEFTPTVPRLAEAVEAWVSLHGGDINRQRLNKLARSDSADPRAKRWQALDPRGTRAPLKGRSRAARRGRSGKPLGDRSPSASTLYLRSRDVLGNDSRAFLIVQLLSHEGGARLRAVADSTGYTYRSLSDAAVGLERSRAIRIDRGHCVLLNRAPWAELLACPAKGATTVDWHAAFAAALTLLRTLKKAKERGLPRDHALVRSASESTRDSLLKAAGWSSLERCPAIAFLSHAIRTGE